MTKVLTDYQQDLKVLLGDASGRRYSTDILNMGLREALRIYSQYQPYVLVYTAEVECYEGDLAKISFDQLSDPLPMDMIVLTVQRNAGNYDFLRHAYYRDQETLTIYLQFSETVRPAVGDSLKIRVGLTHKIKGLDSETTTTVPDSMALVLENGAAAAAIRIRQRSVTEVFGKRPEDTEHLNAQANALDRRFYEGLQTINQPVVDPLPRGGFEI